MDCIVHGVTKSQTRLNNFPFTSLQDPPTCTHISLSQDRSYWKGVWVEHPLDMTPLWPPRSIFCTCMLKDVSWLWEQEICDLCRVQPPPLIALLFVCVFATFFIFNWMVIVFTELLFSVKHQQESAIGIPMCPPSEPASHLPPHPTLLDCHRAPVWVPWAL